MQPKDKLRQTNLQSYAMLRKSLKEGDNMQKAMLRDLQDRHYIQKSYIKQ